MTPYLILSIILISLDQITKYLIRTNFTLYQSKQILPILALTYATNTGVVFGLFANYNIIFIFVIIFVLILVAFSAKNIIQEFGATGKIVVCLIISGGIGNLIDRIFLGKVIDFIDLQWNYRNIWPIFNFADSYVFIGVWILVIKYLICSLNFLKKNRRV